MQLDTFSTMASTPKRSMLSPRLRRTASWISRRWSLDSKPADTYNTWSDFILQKLLPSRPAPAAPLSKSASNPSTTSKTTVSTTSSAPVIVGAGDVYTEIIKPPALPQPRAATTAGSQEEEEPTYSLAEVCASQWFDNLAGKNSTIYNTGRR